MKKYLKLLVALLTVMACILSLASCGDTCPHANVVAVDESVAKDPIGIEPGMTAGKQCADCGAVIEQPHEFYRVTFIFSCKAAISVGGGTQIRDVETEVAYFDFAKDNNNGFTAETEAQAKATAYHGYTFGGWYTAWDKSTQEPAGTDYAFPKEKITANAKVYVDRADRAGENVTWKLEANAKDATKYDLIISGTGPMFDFEFCDGIDIPWYIEREKIVTLVIEDGVTTIGNNAFAELTALTNLDLADSITSIGVNAFLGDKKIRNMTIPAGVTVIRENAFKDCVGLKRLVLNEGLKTIEQLAFYGDKAIVSVVVPTSLETIGNGAFHPGTNNLGTVEIHALKKLFFLGATEDEFDDIDISMDNKWFADFTTLYCYTEDAAEGVTGSYWYLDGEVPVQYTVAISYKASGLSEAIATDYVPVTPVRETDDENENGINNEIIVDSSGNVKGYTGVVLQANVDFRENLSYNGYKFVFDSALVVGAPFNNDLVVTGGRGNMLSDDGGIVWSCYDSNRDLKKDTIKISVGNADGSMIMWDFAYTSDATVYTGGNRDAMSSVTTLIIEPGVTYIGSNVFAGYTGITEVYIPATVTEIHPEAFSGCTNLTAVYYEGTSLADCENITALVNASADIVAFAKTESAVATAGSYWMSINDKTIAWKLEGSTLTISGNSDMMDFATAADAPWYGAKDSITSVVITVGIVNVGDNIVNGYTGVTSIKLHNKIREVSGSAFAGTGVLTNTANYVNGAVVVDGVLLKVAENAGELFKTYKGMMVIAEGAFDGCANIKKLFVVKGIIYISEGACSDLALDAVYFETKASMTKYASSAFSNVAKKYFYSETPDVEGFYYDNSGNIVPYSPN